MRVKYLIGAVILVCAATAPAFADSYYVVQDSHEEMHRGRAEANDHDNHRGGRWQGLHVADRSGKCHEDRDNLPKQIVHPSESKGPPVRWPFRL